MACANDADAQTFSRNFGTRKKVDVSTHTQMDIQEVTQITTKQVDDFIVTPQDIKDIVPGTGMGYLYRKAVGKKPCKITVYKKY